MLLDRLRKIESPIAAACFALSADSIQLEGWDELNAEIEQTDCTALGIDLSNYNDSLTGEWHQKEPCLEVGYYSDRPFPFSTFSREEILSRCADYPSPWQGSFKSIGGELRLTGLLDLNSEILKSENRDSAAHSLGEWFMHLRFHQAVARELSQRGLAKRIPVVVGAHDVGPFLESVYMVDRLADHRASTDRIRAERKAAAEARRRELLEENDALFRRMREEIRGWWWFINPKQRQTYIEYCEARVSLIGLDPASRFGKPFWKLSDKQFEQIVAEFRAEHSSSS